MRLNEADTDKNSPAGGKTVTGKLTAADLSLFCYQLSLIFKSGIPFLEGMHLFTEEMEDSKFKRLSREIYRLVFEGTGLGDALEKQKAFPSYMISMIRIAEATGALDIELERLSAYYDKSEKLSRRMRNAITYPVILAVLMGGVILLLILKILPMFHEILVSVGGEIPAVTRVILNISTGISNNYLIIITILVILVAVFLLFSKTGTGQRKLDEWKIKIPLVRTINLKIISARFSMGMAMLLKGGIVFDDALGMVRNIVGNTFVADKITQCRKDITEGADTAEAFGRLGIFPAMLVKMLNIGYKTGELEKTMAKISDIYETEVDRYMSRVTSAIEPVLVIILSVIVGIILLAVMLPLISIMSSIG